MLLAYLLACPSRTKKRTTPRCSMRVNDSASRRATASVGSAGNRVHGRALRAAIDENAVNGQHLRMARTVITQITDDLDGSPNAKEVAFSYDGVDYVIDLAKKNRAAFAQALKPYV